MADSIQYESLIKIVYIDNKINHHLKNIEEEKNRVKLLVEQHKCKSTTLSSKNVDLGRCNHSLEEKGPELKKIDEQYNRNKKSLAASTSSSAINYIEKQLSEISQKKKKLESEILELMEKTEKSSLEIKDVEQHILSLESAIKEISDEVEVKVKDQVQQISQYESEQSLLLEGLTRELRTLYNIVITKYRFKNPLARVVNNHCNQCFIQIAFEDIINLDRGKVIVTCHRCGRILLPSSFS
ncbi:MAG: hypothetical protein HQK53_02945 [Oligoflexia bacterium]|nr:hypothetical protein [Oligoflexia bacterium]